MLDLRLEPALNPQIVPQPLKHRDIDVPHPASIALIILETDGYCNKPQVHLIAVPFLYPCCSKYPCPPSSSAPSAADFHHEYHNSMAVNFPMVLGLSVVESMHPMMPEQLDVTLVEVRWAELLEAAQWLRGEETSSSKKAASGQTPFDFERMNDSVAA
jgi:hypothetical protein